MKRYIIHHHVHIGSHLTFCEHCITFILQNPSAKKDEIVNLQFTELLNKIKKGDILATDVLQAYQLTVKNYTIVIHAELMWQTPIGKQVVPH